MGSLRLVKRPQRATVPLQLVRTVRSLLGRVMACRMRAANCHWPSPLWAYSAILNVLAKTRVDVGERDSVILGSKGKCSPSQNVCRLLANDPENLGNQQIAADLMTPVRLFGPAAIMSTSTIRP